MKSIRLATVAAVVLTIAGTGKLAAQHRDARLVATEPGRLLVPLCQLRPSGKVNDALRQLRTGIEDKDPARRVEGLAKAEQILLQDIQGGNQNPAAWYYLARAYLAQGDVAGADSAFRRVESAIPDCELDIKQYRQNAWAELANAGIELQQQGASDSALALFREASTIFGGLPHVFENMGVMFANMGMNDSAAVYFQKALTVAEPDTSLAENRNSAAMNLALMQQRLGRHQEAIGVLRRFLEWKPNDTEARRSIAFSFRELGQVDSAEVVEQALVAEFATMNLDSLGPADLMAVGVTRFNSGSSITSKLDSLATRLDSLRKSAPEDTAGISRLQRETSRLQEERHAAFKQAADIFEKVVTQYPWNRDAVYNLTNTYLALQDNEKLVSTGKRLLDIEPLSEDGHRLVAQGYRGMERQDSLVAVAERLVALRVNVAVTQFALRSGGARWLATATGRAATDPAGKPLPPTPIAIVVEFLTQNGGVVTSEDVSIPALPEGTSHELQVEVTGEEIAAWRYRRKEI